MKPSPFLRGAAAAWLAGLSCLATAPAAAADHFCAIAFPVKRVSFPEVFVVKNFGSDSARHATCKAVNTWADGAVSDTPDCKLGAYEKAARCLESSPDPVVDAIGRGGAGVAGATGPVRRYRCQLGTQPGLNKREQPWEAVDAARWSDVEAAAKRLGARNEPPRGQCMPAELYEALTAGLGR